MTRQLGCFPPRWCAEALKQLDDYNMDNALTWLLANSRVLSAEDEAHRRKVRSLVQWAQEKEDHENEKSEEDEEEDNSVDNRLHFPEMKLCAACSKELPRENFSKTQWQAKQQRRCKDCIADNREVVKPKVCTEAAGCDPSDFPFSIEAWLQACRDTEAWLHCDNPLRGLWMRDVNRLFNLFLERLEDRVMFFNVVLLGLKRDPDLMAGDKARAKAKATEAAAEEAAAALLAELDLEERELHVDNEQKGKKRNGKKKRRKRK